MVVTPVVVPTADLQETALGVAKQLASKAPLTVKYMREAVYRGLDLADRRPGAFRVDVRR